MNLDGPDTDDALIEQIRYWQEALVSLCDYLQFERGLKPNGRELEEVREKVQQFFHDSNSAITTWIGQDIYLVNANDALTWLRLRYGPLERYHGYQHPALRQEVQQMRVTDDRQEREIASRSPSS